MHFVGAVRPTLQLVQNGFAFLGMLESPSLWLFSYNCNSLITIGQCGNGRTMYNIAP